MLIFYTFGKAATEAKRLSQLLGVPHSVVRDGAGWLFPASDSPQQSSTASAPYCTDARHSRLAEENEALQSELAQHKKWLLVCHDTIAQLEDKLGIASKPDERKPNSYLDRFPTGNDWREQK